MNLAKICGQTLDEKYCIERELGRGGMGTVFLATHLGTDRPVAVKVIAPQFMERPEFVERFRREARAAGRLRHPNVVDVTDFGFAECDEGRVAYLVMEYLDGCTLGEILEEEGSLPVAWTLDIIEQVCSAVHEAHSQGIIHRDLKPDNIWLEPNRRGGYTVKVLDFGIAKLEFDNGGHDSIHISVMPVLPTIAGQSPAMTTAAAPGDAAGETLLEHPAATLASERSTRLLYEMPSSEQLTAILPAGGSKIEKIDSDAADSATSHFHEGASSADAGLTHAGAVLGTPLYMSPEQCRGEKLDARSDVYSIGVIAYQMLTGAPPFTGAFTDVMRAHRELPPPPLIAKKVRPKLKRIIASALTKNPEDRPQGAEAFANILRSRSEGIFGLLRRSLIIYTENMPKFLVIALLLYLPYIVMVVAKISLGYEFGGSASQTMTGSAMLALVTVAGAAVSFFCGNLIVGTTTWLVNQILSYPLKPVRLAPALLATKANWRPLFLTTIAATLLTIAGYLLCVVPGVILSVIFALVAPVVMIENRRGWAAMKRSKQLVMKSLRTTTAAVAILFFVPFTVGLFLDYTVVLSLKPLTTTSAPAGSANAATAGVSQTADTKNGQVATTAAASNVSDGHAFGFWRESLNALLMLPLQIILFSLSSIVVSLLYIKTRQAGGESLSDLMAKFEDDGVPQKRWQQRVRQRLLYSGRVVSGQ